MDAARRFRPLALLGRGSMGVVYRAYDAEMEQDVALKTLDNLDGDQLYRLKREFRALASVSHPNLVTLLDLVVGADEAFFTMELVDGPDFVAHVRGDAPPGARPDLVRLQDAAPQLALGISALHAANKLHRDVKPSNVLVTRDGRVVLVDFGLATAFDVEHDGDAGPFGGTPAYMAPEQLWGARPDPAADWYGMGVVLYEALTGRLPFAGSAPEMLRAKERGQLVPPDALVPGLPARLAGLVVRLLAPDPDRRPGPQEVLEQLDGGPRRRGRERPRARVPGATVPLVGRAAELGRLRTVLAAVRDGRPAVVHVTGPSGIGKTELVQRFCTAVDIEGAALALRGRCHPQESVPFEAVDALIDGLSGVLCSMTGTEGLPLAPDEAGALVRLFPVLARVPALAATRAPGGVEPQEVRRRGFQALRALCGALARRRALVLWIDDLQWGDADSGALLRELLRPPDAPPVLLVVSYRSEERERMPILRVLDDGDVPGERIELGPLAPPDVEALTRLLAPPGLDAAAHDAVAREAGGSPFLIAALTRHLGAVGRRQRPRLDLAELMTDRLARLPAGARDVLELVAVAGGPLDRSVLLAAAGLGEAGRPLVSTLRQDCLVRSTVTGERPAVEPYHDRLRDVVLAGLPADRRRARHRALAGALAARPDPDAEALFQHWSGAGDAGRAAHWATVAADRAAGVLAFDRAAELYRQALELGGDPARTPELLARLGDALADAGRGGEAADRFLEAVERAGPTTAPGDVGLWRRRAAEQYLRSGHLAPGVATTRAVLAAVGVAMPRGPRTALAVALTQRARLELRRFRYRPRARADVPPEAIERLDACWGAAITMSLVDQAVCEALGVRHLVEALQLGEPSRLVRAFGFEAAREAAFGGAFFRRRSRRLLRWTARLARGSDDPYDRAWLDLAVGTVAYMSCRWRLARRRCDAATARWRAHCTGVAWEIVTAEAFALSALAHMGALGELGRRLPAAMADADERGDVYAAVGFRTGVPSMHWLALDRAAEARDAADAAIRRWPTIGFHVQHYLHLLAAVQAELYLGEPASAWARIEAAWPALRRALFLRMESVGVELRHLRGRTALACAAAGVRTGDCDVRTFIEVAAREAAQIERARVPTAAAFALLLRAGVARLCGADAAARDGLARAAAALDRADMRLYAAAARAGAGGLEAGGTGAEPVAAADEFMRAQGVRCPARMAAMLVPGLVPAPLGRLSARAA